MQDEEAYDPPTHGGGIKGFFAELKKAPPWVWIGIILAAITLVIAYLSYQNSQNASQGTTAPATADIGQGSNPINTGTGFSSGGTDGSGLPVNSPAPAPPTVTAAIDPSQFKWWSWFWSDYTSRHPGAVAPTSVTPGDPFWLAYWNWIANRFRGTPTTPITRQPSPPKEPLIPVNGKTTARHPAPEPLVRPNITRTPAILRRSS